MVNKESRSSLSIKAIHEAFLKLLMEKPYDEFNIRHVIESAGVARSTFYEHFKNKDDLLIWSMEEIYYEFGRNVFCEADIESNNQLLEQLWVKRAVLRRLSTPPFFIKIVYGFDEYLYKRIENLDLDVPARALSKQIAFALLTPVNGWLQGEFQTTTEQLSSLLLSVRKLLESHQI